MSQVKWVLHLCGMMSVGGVQAMLMSFYKNINTEKVQFAFAVQRNFDYDYDEEIKKLGGRIHFLPDMIKDGKAYRKELSKLLKTHPEYKIVHCHFNHRNWIMLDVAKKMQVPVRISHAHAANVKTRLTSIVHLGYLSLKIRNRATRFLACSYASGEYLYCSKNFEILHNAIDIDKFRFNNNHRKRLRDEIGVSDDDILIGQIGHINENKNQMFSLEVLRGLPINYKLAIVGTGPLKDEVENKASDLGMTTRVKFLGVRNDVNELLSAFDALIFPSIHEGLGLVCIEAQASGLPVVASTNVPNEICITKLVKQYPLDSINKWIDFFGQINPAERSVDNRSLIDAGYSIKNEAQNLENLYLEEYTRL